MKLQVTEGPEENTANERKRNENVEGGKQRERMVNRQEDEEEK